MYRYYQNDNRFGGSFLGPFILGGLTGGLVAPYFYQPNYGPRPYNYSYNNYYYPYCQGPYCR